MTSRRSLILGAVAVLASGVGLAATRRHDDVVRLLEVQPKTVRDPADAALLAEVRTQHRLLLSRAGGASPGALGTLAEQLQAVGGDPTTVTPRGVADLAGELAAAADQRASQAAQARSGALAQVLASMAGGLDMLAESV